MATSSGGKPPNDWSDIVDDLGESAERRDRGARVREERAPTEVDGLHGRASDPVELIAAPNAVENEELYAYRPSAAELPGGRAVRTDSTAGEAPHERGLSLPRPPPDPRAGSGRASRSMPLPEAVPRALFEGPAQAPGRGPLRRPGPGPSRTPWIVGVVTLAAAGAGLWFVTRPPPPLPTGMVSVVSDPTGAEVWVDGQPLGRTTPTQIFDVEVGRALRVEVRKPGFGVEPPLRVVEVVGEGAATAYFTLVPVRSIRVETRPEGAEIRVDGKPVPGRTPLEISGLEVGKTVTIEASLDEHLPAELQHTVTDAGEPPPPIELVKAVGLTVITEPAGAEVKWGERSLGLTPLYDAPVPSGRRITVRIDKSGYRPAVRKLRLREAEELRLTLSEQPLTALPLSRSERTEARRIDQAMVTAQRRETAARRAVKVAEARLEAILADSKSLFSTRAKAERAVDAAHQRLVAAQDAVVEAQAEVDRFRARVLTRSDEP